MEPIIKETKVIHDDDYNGRGDRFRDPAARTLGIIGTVGAGLALLGRGGLGAITGGGPSVTNNYSGGGSYAPTTYEVASKECADILSVTKGYYDLAISGLKSASAAREVDVREKFGLYVNNRDNIDRVSNRINDELFSLYKYTRDKDDETNAKIYELAKDVEVNTKIRPYQDKLIMCELEKNFAFLKNYIDAKMCNVIRGVNTLPLTPTVTGVVGQTCGCYPYAAFAAAAATPAADATTPAA